MKNCEHTPWSSKYRGMAPGSKNAMERHRSGILKLQGCQPSFVARLGWDGGDESMGVFSREWYLLEIA
jgi:hypothetical protein